MGYGGSSTRKPMKGMTGKKGMAGGKKLGRC